MVLRLEYRHVYPLGKQQTINKYLKGVSSDILLKVIGFNTTYHNINYNNIFSDPQLQSDINNKVKEFRRKNPDISNIELMSKEGSLRLAEIILSRREELITNKLENYEGELNMFKSILVINRGLNRKQKFISSEENFDKIVDMYITFQFPTSDFGVFENDRMEIIKLIYVTNYKYDLLINFLQSRDEYEYLIKGLYEYFGLKSILELTIEMKYLFGKLMELIHNQGYLFSVENEKSIRFLNSLVSDSIVEDYDFTTLKNHPIYKVDDDRYSIINHFFVIDKFYKSVRFILKSSFEEYHELEPSSREFFSFFNLKFTEEILMGDVLNKIFKDEHLVKKSISENPKKEPDYYIRKGNIIFLFEFKDVLVNKKIKSSSDIDLIDEMLKEKFCKEKKPSIGVGQLVNHIESIQNNKFQYDDYVNTESDLIIYPILIVGDRIFEVLGINYRLNNWFIDMIENRLGESFDSDKIKPLSFIDIDTLIYWLSGLENNYDGFKQIIDNHITTMTTKVRSVHPNPTINQEMTTKFITDQLTPISFRPTEFEFPLDLFMESFNEVLNNKEE